MLRIIHNPQTGFTVADEAQEPLSTQTDIECALAFCQGVAHGPQDDGNEEKEIGLIVGQNGDDMEFKAVQCNILEDAYGFHVSGKNSAQVTVPDANSVVRLCKQAAGEHPFNITFQPEWGMVIFDPTNTAAHAAYEAGIDLGRQL